MYWHKGANSLTTDRSPIPHRRQRLGRARRKQTNAQPEELECETSFRRFAPPSFAHSYAICSLCITTYPPPLPKSKPTIPIMDDDVPHTRKRARGSYAKLICFRCRERRIKCQLADDGSVIPSSNPQPPDKACQRCHQQGLECIVRKTTLGRPNLKKQRILTPASSGPSVDVERQSRSPSPDPEALVFLTLDEDKTSGRARSASVKELPTGVHMYGAVNRTFDLTSSILGRDKVGRWQIL